MLRSEKQEFVTFLEEIYQESNSIVITHYHGLTVDQLTTLRKSLREKGGKLKIAKNTLLRIAASKSGMERVNKLFTGPTAFVYSANPDPTVAVRVIAEFVKSNDKLKIIGGIVNTQLLDANQVDQLAKLPSLHELQGKIVYLLQVPASKIAATLQAPAAQLTRLFKAYADKN